MEHKMTDTEAIRQFIFGGKATFTVRSLTSGKHWSFKINKHETDDVYFVKALAGEFYYIGYIKSGKYNNSKKLEYSEESAATHQVMVYLLSYIQKGYLHPKFEFFHVGKCAACGRPLTDPTSIERGFGPHCASRL